MSTTLFVHNIKTSLCCGMGHKSNQQSNAYPLKLMLLVGAGRGHTSSGPSPHTITYKNINDVFEMKRNQRN